MRETEKGGEREKTDEEEQVREEQDYGAFPWSPHRKHDTRTYTTHMYMRSTEGEKTKKSITRSNHLAITRSTTGEKREIRAPRVSIPFYHPKHKRRKRRSRASRVPIRFSSPWLTTTIFTVHPANRDSEFHCASHKTVLLSTFPYVTIL